MQIVRVPTRNFTEQSASRNVRGIVFHSINSTESALSNWITNPESELSFHYFIATPRTIIQYVEENNIAWHSGDTPKHGNINTFSIGVAITSKAWNISALDHLSDWLAELCDRNSIKPSAHTICRHQDFEPSSSTALNVPADEFAKLIELTLDKYMEIQRLKSQVVQLEEEKIALQQQLAGSQPSNPDNESVPTSRPITRRLNAFGYGELITALVTKIFARR